MVSMDFDASAIESLPQDFLEIELPQGERVGILAVERTEIGTDTARFTGANGEAIDSMRSFQNGRHQAQRVEEPERLRPRGRHRSRELRSLS
jgi:hypothetical protein